MFFIMCSAVLFFISFAMCLKISASDISMFKTLHIFIPFATCICVSYQKNHELISFFLSFSTPSILVRLIPLQYS